MMETLRLNERALRIVESALAKADELRIEVSRLAGGTTLVDCGIMAEGGLQAGLLLARICLAGLGEVKLHSGGDFPLVHVHTDWPIAACMASQYAGWQISVGKYFAMGSGPMRAAAGREDLFQKIGHVENASTAVGVLETRKLPDAAVARYISERAKVSIDQLTLFCAPTASQAGGLQIAARSVETALHKLYELGFDLKQVMSGCGSAPLPPVAKDDLTAIGRTNDAILYGGRATLWVRADDGVLAEIGPRVPSCASSDHGQPFAAIFERYQRDFYKIDPMLFSPAEVLICNLTTGRLHRYGRLEPEIIQQSFAA